jgi:hypothetical protein
MRFAFLFLSGALVAISGCTMFAAWKSIPPPGGCDQCHKVAISNNWQATYKPADISNEQGRLSFQTPEFNQPYLGGQQSPLDEKKVEEKACFDCHKSPSAAHRDRKGRYHH